jgi:hypothetical protein
MLSEDQDLSSGPQLPLEQKMASFLGCFKLSRDQSIVKAPS